MKAIRMHNGTTEFDLYSAMHIVRVPNEDPKDPHPRGFLLIPWRKKSRIPPNPRGSHKIKLGIPHPQMLLPWDSQRRKKSI